MTTYTKIVCDHKDCENSIESLKSIMTAEQYPGWRAKIVGRNQVRHRCPDHNKDRGWSLHVNGVWGS